MPITDYFLAPDDATAARVLGETTGPLGAGLPTVEAKNLDPYVNLGFLEEIVTGRPYDEVIGASRHAHPVSDTGELPIVMTVTDTLRDALAALDDTRILDVAARWAQTAELAGSDPEGLAGFLHRLAGLAREAGDEHLYCYWAS